MKHIFQKLSLLASVAKFNLLYFPLPLRLEGIFFFFCGSCFGSCFPREISTVTVILIKVGYLIVGSYKPSSFLAKCFLIIPSLTTRQVVISLAFHIGNKKGTVNETILFFTSSSLFYSFIYKE